MNFEYAFTLFLYFLQCVEHGAIFIALLYVIFASFCIGEAIGETRAEERERKRKRKLENETVD